MFIAGKAKTSHGKIQGISFINAWFMAVSATTCTGLNTVPLSGMNTFQHAVMFVDFVAGCYNTTNLGTVSARVKVLQPFAMQYLALPNQRRDRLEADIEETSSTEVEVPESEASSVLRRRTGTARRNSSGEEIEMDDLEAEVPHVHFDAFQQPASSSLRARLAVFGQRLKFWQRPKKQRIGRHGRMGRNSEFHNLTPEERLYYHYQSWVFLRIVWWLDLIGTAITILAGGGVVWYYFVHVNVLASTKFAQNTKWNAIFTTMAAYSNGGMNLSDDNLVYFVSKWPLLLAICLLILCGNTGIPLFTRWRTVAFRAFIARFVKWQWPKRWSILEKLQGKCAIAIKALDFALEHPRRNLTHMFIQKGNSTLKVYKGRTYVMAGLFQAFGIQSSGINVIPISDLDITIIFFAFLMMTTAQYPVCMAIRTSNVFQDRQLGNFDEEIMLRDNRAEQHPGIPSKIVFWIAKKLKIEASLIFLWRQFRRQAAGDWPTVLGATAIIIWIEENFGANTDRFTFPKGLGGAFKIFFEVVSAYGCVGLSLGSATGPTSYSGDWHWASKLIFSYVMYRGRHRGLPIAMDHAIELHEVAEQAKMEEEDGEERMRHSSRATTPMTHFEVAEEMISISTSSSRSARPRRRSV